MAQSADRARQAHRSAATDPLRGDREDGVTMKRAKDPQREAEVDPVMGALRDLVERIESASYFDQHGRLLELDPAFVEARDLVHGYTGLGPASAPPHG
jgi:hypothetical protein